MCAYTWVSIQLALQEVEQYAWWSHWQPSYCQWTIVIWSTIPFVACKSKVHFDTIVLNSSKTYSCCSTSNVRIALLQPMALKRNVRTINSSKCATDEIVETMFIPSRPPEVSACISTWKCVVRFETECGRGARISSRLSTILNLPNMSTMVRHIISHLNAMHFKKLIGCIDNQEIN